MTIDLHGYHPAEIVRSGVLSKVVQQSWEMGERYLYLIHGHGRNRGITPGFVNTNTGYFGLQIRQALRHDKSIRTWIHHTTLNCEDMGVTSVRLKRNPAPSSSRFDFDLIPDAVVESDRD
ncbi:MAG: Smr/MutS family protein [Terracidiphilus sp.]